jgi:hypothetical protein
MEATRKASSSTAAPWGEIVNERLTGLTISALPPTLKLPALPMAVTQFLGSFPATGHNPETTRPNHRDRQRDSRSNCCDT